MTHEELDRLVKETCCLVGTEEMEEIIKELTRDFGKETAKEYQDEIDKLLFDWQ